MTDIQTFEAHRPAMLALAYRMLGDLARAEDMVQEAFLRWERAGAEVDAPKPYLLTTVTRLCLDELDSARARREESRGDRLPEPVALEDSGIGRVEMLDQISMAFLVLLQRLTPAERAVLLLHDVFDLHHDEIAALLGNTDAACRQLLSRARTHVSSDKRVFRTTAEEHRRVLFAFVNAVNDGDPAAFEQLLAQDAVLIPDAGPNGARFGRVKNTGRPVLGKKRVAALLRSLARQDVPRATIEERELNGEPAALVHREDGTSSVIMVTVADGLIRHIFVHLDQERLRHVGRS